MIIGVSVSVALYLLLVAPVLVAGAYAIRRREPGSIERATTDVQHFIELRERAHAKLVETGSLDEFAAIKNEARKRLWQPRTPRAEWAEPDMRKPDVPRESDSLGLRHALTAIGLRSRQARLSR